MTKESEQQILELLRKAIRAENGVKRWVEGVAILLTVAVIGTGLAVWRTQAVIGQTLASHEKAIDRNTERIDAVGTKAQAGLTLAESIKSDVSALRDALWEE